MSKKDSYNLLELQELIESLVDKEQTEISASELREKYTRSIDKKSKIIAIREKIAYMNNYKGIRTVSGIYSYGKYLKIIDDTLEDAMNATDDSIYDEVLIELSNDLDREISKLKILSNVDKYRETNPYSITFLEYNINGIILRVDTKNQKYEISYDDNIMNLLTECKINKLKKLLLNKLPSISSTEIIEPKYVNEKTLYNYIYGSNFNLQDYLKYNYNGLLRYLSIDTDIKAIPSIEELIDNHKSLKELFDFIKILESYGYKTEKDKLQSISEKMLRKYQNINLEFVPNINIVISNIVMNCYPNENFVYSSLQSAYNCINREIIKKAHQELTKKKKENSVCIDLVIEFLKKYTRNKDGEIYKDDEILNFLKQKNDIVNTRFTSDSYDYNYGISNDTIDSKINDIMHKMTDRHR